jgi:hypothetical protein
LDTPIKFQTIFTQIVYIHMPGPEEPDAQMTGEELLHGFLAGLKSAPTKEVEEIIRSLCLKWKVKYEEIKDNRLH